jgi:arginine deiminase
MEAAGIEVRTYRGEEISRNGDGGPTCLTLPLSRDLGPRSGPSNPDSA